MGIEADLFMLSRGRSDVQADLSSGESGSLVGNTRGDLCVVQALPVLAELVRMRNSYVVSLDQAGTAVAPSTALPTTSAAGGMSLWNGENDGGKIYIIDSVFVHVVVSAAAATPIGLACMLNIGRQPAGTYTSDLTPRGLAGQVYRGAAVVDLAFAGVLVDDSWCSIGNSVTGAASQIMQAVDIPLQGLYIVPPQQAFHIVPLANTAATITVKFGIRWHEVQLPVGN